MKKVICFAGALISLFVINSVFAQVAQPPSHYFLMVSGIPGESLDPQHMNWIDIISFKEAITHPLVGTQTAAAQVTERAQFADLTIIKRMDKASVMLKNYCSTGQPIKEVILSCIQKTITRIPPAGVRYPPPEIYNIRMKNVIVSGAKVSADSNGFLEEINLRFGSIEWKYVQADTAGAKVSEIRSGFDLTTKRPY